QAAPLTARGLKPGPRPADKRDTRTLVGTMTSVDLGWLEIERARYETLLDSLTGLPRWGLLIDRTAVAIARAERSGTEVAVFVVEQPHFADRAYDVLRVVEALQDRLRPDDTLARIGEQRFA